MDGTERRKTKDEDEDEDENEEEKRRANPPKTRVGHPRFVEWLGFWCDSVAVFCGSDDTGVGLGFGARNFGRCALRVVGRTLNGGTEMKKNVMLTVLCMIVALVALVWLPTAAFAQRGGGGHGGGGGFHGGGGGFHGGGDAFRGSVGGVHASGGGFSGSVSGYHGARSYGYGGGHYGYYGRGYYGGR